MIYAITIWKKKLFFCFLLKNDVADRDDKDLILNCICNEMNLVKNHIQQYRSGSMKMRVIVTDKNAIENHNREQKIFTELKKMGLKLEQFHN